MCSPFCVLELVAINVGLRDQCGSFNRNTTSIKELIVGQCDKETGAKQMNGCLAA
jgi:hypothetical protein